MGQLLQIGIRWPLQDGFIQIAFYCHYYYCKSQRSKCGRGCWYCGEDHYFPVFGPVVHALYGVSTLCSEYWCWKYDRARATLRYALMIAVGFGIIVSIVIQFIAEPVVGLFTTDEVVKTMGGQYLRGYIFDCVFAGYAFQLQRVFLRIWKIRIFFPAQYYLYLAGEDSGRVSDIKLFPQVCFLWESQRLWITVIRDLV